MKNPYQIILEPLVTEKTTTQKDQSNTVSFKVATSATKSQIKKAVSSIFGVKVEKVKTMNMSGKAKRLGRFLGQRSDWKKAIVTLGEGEKIEYFEGA